MKRRTDDCDLNIIGVKLFEFGDKFRGKYDASVGTVKSYYASVSGYKDELLWAALWLFEATDNQQYLEYVVNKAHCFGGIGWAISEFSWDVKYAGVQLIASKVTKILKTLPKFHSSFLTLLSIQSYEHTSTALNAVIAIENMVKFESIPGLHTH